MRASNLSDSKLPAYPPVWAETFGQDQFGLFAECSFQGIQFVFRWVPPGQFLMGSPPDEKGRTSDEGPQQEIILTKGFWLGETPVTKAQWGIIHPAREVNAWKTSHSIDIKTKLALKDLIALSGRIESAVESWKHVRIEREWKKFESMHFSVVSQPDPVLKEALEGWKNIFSRAGFDKMEVKKWKLNLSMIFQQQDLPIVNVSWREAVGYCDGLAGIFPELLASLPTEAQWEYACRAGTTSAFHDGSDCTVPDGLDPALDRLGWFDANSGGSVHPVRQKVPNAWGLFDMHGNVWEWCRDPWNPEIEEDDGAERVVRGGSWSNMALVCRAAFRSGSKPRKGWRGSGLRLCAAQEPRPADLLGALLPFKPLPVSGGDVPSDTTDTVDWRFGWEDLDDREARIERLAEYAESLDRKNSTKGRKKK